MQRTKNTLSNSTLFWWEKAIDFANSSAPKDGKTKSMHCLQANCNHKAYKRVRYQPRVGKTTRNGYKMSKHYQFCHAKTLRQLYQTYISLLAMIKSDEFPYLFGEVKTQQLCRTTHRTSPPDPTCWHMEMIVEEQKEVIDNN